MILKAAIQQHLLRKKNLSSECAAVICLCLKLPINERKRRRRAMNHFLAKQQSLWFWVSSSVLRACVYLYLRLHNTTVESFQETPSNKRRHVAPMSAPPAGRSPPVATRRMRFTGGSDATCTLVVVRGEVASGRVQRRQVIGCWREQPRRGGGGEEFSEICHTGLVNDLLPFWNLPADIVKKRFIIWKLVYVSKKRGSSVLKMVKRETTGAKFSIYLSVFLFLSLFPCVFLSVCFFKSIISKAIIAICRHLHGMIRSSKAIIAHNSHYLSRKILLCHPLFPRVCCQDWLCFSL